MDLLKYICLFLAIIYTFSNTVKAFRGLPISSPQLWLMGIGIVGYLILA